MKKNLNQPDSSLAAALDILGGRWKVFILQQLVQGTYRFGELRKAIPAVTQKMLTQELRELEEAGLIQRKAYPQVPPRVDYSLTAHGMSLSPILWALEEWGYQHRQYLGLEPAEPSQLLYDQDLALPAAVDDPEPAPRPSPARAVPVNHEDLTEAIRAAAM